MKHIFLALMGACCAISMAEAQHIYNAIIKDKKSNEPLLGVTVQIQSTAIGTASDANGKVQLVNIPAGKQILVFNYVGYETRSDTLYFPLANTEPTLVSLSESAENLEEIIVTSTRSSRSINDLPTRIEAVTAEELDEKATMKPGEIRMLLSESTGIQTQQTSAASGNQTIRIQGLDGRYTQLLKDGFPLYSGFAGGLSIMQIPPLDLKQVEVIKGSASTLYGGGAIAGLINMISKTPSEKPELSFMLNGTSAKGLDASGFYSAKKNKIGVTAFGAYNGSTAYDPSGNGFSAIPQYGRFTFNPKVFYDFTPKTKIMFGVNASYENRLGGDMRYIKSPKDSLFFERNVSQRVATQLSLDHNFGKCSHVNFKNSVSYFGRDISKPNYLFSGSQVASFNELSYANHDEKLDWVAGINLWTDLFTENKQGNYTGRSYNSITTGAFTQNTWKIAPVFTLETGMRIDYALLSNQEGNSKSEVFYLPRISGLLKFNKSLSARLGGGVGYKTPSIFTEAAESRAFQNVRYLNFEKVNAERSYGGNLDFNYKTIIADEITLTVNQLFFYTILNNPLIFNADSLLANIYTFENANGHLETKGTETNAKIGYKDFKLFLGYTFVDAERHFNGQYSIVPLTAKHRINSILMFEKENNIRIGLEAFYVSAQTLSNGFQTRDYWIFGVSVQKWWGKFIPFINFENFTDTRQTRFGNIYTGSKINPDFMEIYAPLDGFIFNGGLKISL